MLAFSLPSKLCYTYVNLSSIILSYHSSTDVFVPLLKDVSKNTSHSDTTSSERLGCPWFLASACRYSTVGDECEVISSGGSLYLPRFAGDFSSVSMLQSSA